VRRWYLLLAGVCAGWGTIPLLLSRMDLPPQAIAWGRVSTAAVALGVVAALAPDRSSSVDPPKPFSVQPLRCLVNGSLLATHWLTMFMAYDRAPAGTVILIIFLAPVGVALAAPGVLGERVTARTMGAALLGLVGVGLIAGPQLDQVDGFGLAAAVLSMLLLVGLNLVSKPLAVVYGGRRLTFIQTTVAALVLLPVAALADWDGLGSSWPWLLTLGLVHTAFGVSLYLAAMRHLPVTHVSIIGYLEPASVVVLAWLILSEQPTLATLLGGLLVVGAGALVILSGRAGRPSPSALEEGATPVAAR
jgi:drug/metabolite transporter (DMT)-like permease